MIRSLQIIEKRDRGGFRNRCRRIEAELVLRFANERNEIEFFDQEKRTTCVARKTRRPSKRFRFFRFVFARRHEESVLSLIKSRLVAVNLTQRDREVDSCTIVPARSPEREAGFGLGETSPITSR